MATTAEAIDLIADTADMLRATVFRAARSLREADTALWPQGSQGKGMEAHVEPAHLVNLALAIAVADPVTSAPTVVPFYRGLTSGTGHAVRLDGDTPVELKDEHWGEVGLLMRGVVREGSDLGSDLERLVDLMADNQTAAPRLYDARFRIEFIPHAKFPAVTTSYVPTNVAANASSSRQFTYLRNQQIETTKPRILRKVVLDTDLFVCLGTLWSDTKRHRTRWQGIPGARMQMTFRKSK